MRKALITAILLILIAGCQPAEKQKKPPVPHVKTMVIAKQNIPLIKTYIGITQSTAAVAIRARVKGFLESMKFTEGKPVQKDQMLFTIEPKPFEARLALAKATLSKAIADMEYEQVEYLRMKQLVGKGDIAKSRFDQAAAKYREAQAQVEIEKAQVEQAQINLGYCYVRSPDDGIIGQRFVDVGNLVGGAENTLLANIFKLNPMYVLFNPSIQDYAVFLKYRKNMPFKVKAQMPHNSSLQFDGEVDLIDNQADTGTATILMRAQLENPERLLLPGIYLNVDLIVSSEVSVIRIPTVAIIEQQTERVVYTVDSENTVHAVPITTEGTYQHDTIVEAGLKPGDRIILSGVQRIRPGMQVTFEPQKEDKA